MSTSSTAQPQNPHNTANVPVKGGKPELGNAAEIARPALDANAATTFPVTANGGNVRRGDRRSMQTAGSQVQLPPDAGAQRNMTDERDSPQPFELSEATPDALLALDEAVAVNWSEVSEVDIGQGLQESGNSGGSKETSTVSGGSSGFGLQPGTVLFSGLGIAAVAAIANTSDEAIAPRQGEVIDGYLSGATVFIDEDRDAVLDANEIRTTTDAAGKFTLPGDRSGPTVAFGGTDTATKLPFTGVLRAPAGASVVTPLTTLVDLLVEKTPSLSFAQAQAIVLSALGISIPTGVSVNLLTFDPIEESTKAGNNATAKATALNLQKAGVLVASLLVGIQEEAVAAGAVSPSSTASASKIFGALAEMLTANALTSGSVSATASALTQKVADQPAAFGLSLSPVAKQALIDRKPEIAKVAAQFAQDLGSVERLEDLAALQRKLDIGTEIVTATIDGNLKTLVLFFNDVLDSANTAGKTQFTVQNGQGSVMVDDVLTNGNQVTLKLATALDPTKVTTVSYADASAGNEIAALQNLAGVDIASFNNIAAQRLSLNGNGAFNFTPVKSIALAGSEISAFDPVSKRVFVTSSNGLQIVEVGADAALTFVKTVSFAEVPVSFSNELNSVAVSNGVVAVAIAASDKTQPGKVFFLNSNGDILGNVNVGALPDMLTFSADGKTLLVANEGEANGPADITAGKSAANPEGSISIVDLSGGVASVTQSKVSTATFTAFNDRAAELKASGVRLFAGNTGFEGLTVAQDLEPEYISISPGGTFALVTLQENNAVAILDLTTRQFIDVVPLGLKNFNGLLADFSDRDGANNTTLTQLLADSPVLGQYMPDAISSFIGVDGRSYFVIANEGDDRDDFIEPDETTRVGSGNFDLDDARFPNEAALKANTALGRLTVSNIAGNRGDTDGDGDVDRILTYGARSFSILSDDGRIVFDSGSHIEQFVAANGLFASGNAAGSGLFDDTRSDNKGPEPEGITIGTVNGRTLAFVGLERGGGGVMVYDVTDPKTVEFVQYVRRDGDVSPEGLTFVKAADSPTGKDLVLVTNEVSNTLSVLENRPFTLQLLHFADAEAGLLASTTAPRMAALIDRFEDQFANSITLAGGDNFLPGPFLAAGTDPSVIAALNQASGSTFAATDTVPIAAADIAIHNILGVQASTVGNHEFDLGSRVLRDAVSSTATYRGAQFPYLSANLDFSKDSDLSGRFTNTVAQAGLERANTLNGRFAPSAVIVENGEKIGLVGATTQLLSAISSPSGTTVIGATGDNMDLLAQQLQPVIDDLRSQGVNKVILMAHLQVLANERLLATKLKGVDIILAAGSNTRLGDSDDKAAAFPGHAANFADTYPVILKDADGNNTLLVNTDNEFTYLGRLVVDFDAEGKIITESLARNKAINGAYAATDENVNTAYGTDIAKAFESGSKGANVKVITDAVQSVITAKDSNVFGFSNVYLEGERANVRSEETNLGNLTADANGFALRQALGSEAANTYIVSLKNGGGIRAQIGTLSAPKGDGTVDKLPPDGGVSQLDVENSLRFNNQLMAFDTTVEGLKAILEHGVAAGTLQGRFPQIGGVKFSWDATNPDGSAIAAGSRVKDIALVGEGYYVNLFNDGVKLDTVVPNGQKITVVTLGFLANGGDSYPIKDNGENFRYLTEAESGVGLSAPVDESLNFTAAASVPTGSAPVLAEQKAIERFLERFHATVQTAFNQADTPANLDTRIQNLDRRAEDVLTAQNDFL